MSDTVWTSSGKLFLIRGPVELVNTVLSAGWDSRWCGLMIGVDASICSHSAGLI